MKMSLDEMSGIIVGLIFLVLILALLPGQMAACEGFFGGIPENFLLNSVMKSREDLNRGQERRMQGVDREERGSTPELASARPQAKCGRRVVGEIGADDVVAGSGVPSVAGLTLEEKQAEVERGDLLEVARGVGVVDPLAVMNALPAESIERRRCAVHSGVGAIAMCLMEEGVISRGDQDRQAMMAKMPREVVGMTEGEREMGFLARV